MRQNFLTPIQGKTVVAKNDLALNNLNYKKTEYKAFSGISNKFSTPKNNCKCLDCVGSREFKLELEAGIPHHFHSLKDTKFKKGNYYLKYPKYDESKMSKINKKRYSQFESSKIIKPSTHYKDMKAYRYNIDLRSLCYQSKAEEKLYNNLNVN